MSTFTQAKKNKMITFPNAKVNLGLFVTQRRPDGFHNIETIFVPIHGLCDILEIVPNPLQSSEVVLTQTGLPVEGPTSDNLCIRAFNLLKQKTELPKVAMHLHKQIPMGSGLGGGSSDAAFALQMLNSLSANPLSDKNLNEVALELGSDCPFFLFNKPCLATGRGELLEPIALNLSGWWIGLINPGIHVSTANAYSQIVPQPTPINLLAQASKPVEHWLPTIANDFEPIVFGLHPELKLLKDKLLEQGAVFAGMSGSGPTLFGIFLHQPQLGGFQGMFTKIMRIDHSQQYGG